MLRVNKCMADELILSGGTKTQIYQDLLPQLLSLYESENDLIATLANTCAALKQTFEFLWVGFYFVKNESLVLGPFQGPVACTRILKGKGVCGKAWENKELQNVQNVHIFPGHIACSSLSNSEIVIPLIKDESVWAVLDIDSEQFAAFDQNDEVYLTEICKWLSEKF